MALNLNDLVIELDSMLRRLLGEDVELVTVTSPDLGTVKADAGQIEQVLMNLVVNARDAMSNGGRLTIETFNTTVEGGFVRLYSSLRPGDYVVPAVSDTGIGMTQDVQEHMFGPSYITKTVGEDTVLELSTCYGIVTQSGGHIAVDRSLSAGTAFRIFLPRVDEEPSSAPRRDEEGFWPRGDATILLVEDEPLVRSLSVEVFEGQGYAVLQAIAGRGHANRQSRANESIDLLLTDIVMRLIDGRELADKFRPVHPEAKVLYMSGYPRDLPEPAPNLLESP
jgi:hypothetical protein